MPRFGISRTINRFQAPGGVTPTRTRVPAPTGGGLTVEPQLSGNVTVQGEADVGATNVLFGASSFVDQFQNPTLVGEQQKAIDALRKTAASRGISGGAIDEQIAALQNQFLAGNRLAAAQGLQSQAQERISAFREQIAPFASFFGDAASQLRGEGSVFGKLRARHEIAQRLQDPAFLEESLFGAFESLGLGDITRSELFARVGGEAGRGQALSASNLENTPLNALLAGATRQLFDPQLSASQLAPGGLLGRRATEGVNRQLDAAVNQLRGGAAISGFLTQQLGGLTGGLDELSLFNLGLAPQSPETILQQDVSQFGDLFQATGLLGGQTTRNPVGTGTSLDFLNQANLFQQQLVAG